jgi:NADPH:quinone reductase-like Zn-dependent oxidoreductase
MKAIVQERFGPPDVLRLVDTDLPEVGAGDVLVRMHAAALNPTTGTSCAVTLWSRG